MSVPVCDATSGKRSHVVFFASPCCQCLPAFICVESDFSLLSITLGAFLFQFSVFLLFLCRILTYVNVTLYTFLICNRLISNGIWNMDFVDT